MVSIKLLSESKFGQTCMIPQVLWPSSYQPQNNRTGVSCKSSSFGAKIKLVGGSFEILLKNVAILLHS